jgi:hypothetical protein
MVGEILAVAAADRTPAQQDVLCDFYLAGFDESYRQTVEALSVAVGQRAEQLKAVASVMVMAELPVARETFVLRGGAFDRPGQRVEPGTPAWLPPFPNQSPPNRLGLAKWLVDPAHPLPARVAVNRLWQHFMGAGLVHTPDNFGSRGEPPTHPELLDWLAVEFIDSGWDVKHVVRLIVTSTTYRQSSDLTPRLAELDPENRWLARASRLRLDAETIRDSALSVSGLLDSRLGGPSVFPYQPAGLWEELSYNAAEFTAQTYVQSHGHDLYRRSLYTFWKRALPPPVMMIFDAPTRETSCIVRARTNTPLQALVLMNDPTFVEAARNLAEQLLREPTDSHATRLRIGFRHVLGRWPEPDELAELFRLLERQRAWFEAEPQESGRLLAVGESDWDRRLPAADLAAWTAVVSVWFSLDEAITRN